MKKYLSVLVVVLAMSAMILGLKSCQEENISRKGQIPTEALQVMESNRYNQNLPDCWYIENKDWGVYITPEMTYVQTDEWYLILCWCATTEFCANDI
ncbi:MAG: hypothetical protein KUG81_06515 [Gammaproteobacteria bacterium]|nr:hypothetical protein [Gammaproteobacteria bacterium]